MVYIFQQIMTRKMESLPEGLEEFIRSQFETMTQVEMLCYFYNHNEIAFSVNKLCHLLYLSERMTAQTLKKLTELGYVEQKDASFKYINGTSAEAKGLLNELVTLFDNRKSLIVEMIFDSFIRGEI